MVTIRIKSLNQPQLLLYLLQVVAGDVQILHRIEWWYQAAGFVFYRTQIIDVHNLMAVDLYKVRREGQNMLRHGVPTERYLFAIVQKRIPLTFRF